MEFGFVVCVNACSADVPSRVLRMPGNLFIPGVGTRRPSVYSIFVVQFEAQRVEEGEAGGTLVPVLDMSQGEGARILSE